MKQLSLIIPLLFVAFSAFTQTTFTWTGATSTNWNTASNWSPVGTPTAIDEIIIVSGTNIPTLVANTTINDFTILSGSLDLGGYTLSSEGDHSFNSGTILNGSFASLSAESSNFTNTTFDATCNLSIITGIVDIDGGIFDGTTYIEQNGTGNIIGNGTAIFNGTTTLKNSGTGYYRTNGGMTFNGTTELIVSGSNYMLLENNNGNTFNGPLTLTMEATASNNLRIGYNGSTTFNNNVTLNNVSNSTIIIGELATATVTLNAGFELSVGALGFSSGQLLLHNFTQNGTTSQTLLFTGTARMTINDNNVFNGTLDFTAPLFTLSNSVYNGEVTFTKTGVNNNNTTGGNIFNDDLTVNHIGTAGYWSFGNGSPEIYNGDVYSNNNSNDRIIFGHNTSGSTFNGNIYLTQIGNSTGTSIGFGGAATTQAAGKSIYIGALGYDTGYLQILGYSQLGTDAIDLTVTGSANVTIGPNSEFQGTVAITAPDIYAHGAIYNNPTIFNKNGGTSNHNNGNQNIFNSSLEINNTSSDYFMLGYNSDDIFNGDISISNTGTGGLNFGWLGGTGTSTLAAGKTIAVGPNGFTDGYLRFGSFTKLGTEAINLNLINSSFHINNVPNTSVFGGPLTVEAADLHIQGGEFNGATSFTKTGTASNHNGGQENTFNSTLEINQHGTGYFMLGYNSNDTFHEDITVTSNNSGTIYLGYSTGTGTPTLSSGKTIHIGGAGFSDGILHLGSFTQLGNTPINLSMGISSSLILNNSQIGGDVNATVGGLYFYDNNFDGEVVFDKTGPLNCGMTGGNTFQQATDITNSGDGYLLLGNGNPDIFNSNLNVTNSGTSIFYFGYNSVGNIINGNLNISQINAANSVNFSNATISTLVVNGNTNITNNSSGSTNSITFPNAGNIDVNGNLSYANISTGANSYINVCNNASSVLNVSGNVDINNSPTGLAGYINFGNSSGSTINIGGTTNVLNSGSGNTKYIYMGYGASVTFQDDLTVTNSSDATTSVIRFNYTATSNNLYQGDIIISSTVPDCDGITFGQATGTGTLIANKTISIGAGGFVSGDLMLRNFTQVGPTPQTLLTTGTTIFNTTDSDWGGDINFSGSTFFTHGTTFRGTSYLEKYGSTSDASTGNNHFFGDSELKNLGSGHFYMGHNNPDVFDGNLIMNNLGSHSMYLSHTSIGNTIAGDLTINNTASVTNNHIYIANTNTSDLSIGGNVVINQNTPGTTGIVYFPNIGDISIGGNLDIFNNSTGGSNGVALCNSGSSPSLDILGNLYIENNASSTTSDTYLANGAGSTVNIAGTSTFINNTSGTNARFYIGNYGTISYDGEVTAINHSSSLNSEMYFSQYASSISTFSDNIKLTCDNANADGVSFGSSTGSSTLAAGKTVSIVGDFLAGRLYFRNFEQIGNTPQTLITTGTTWFENYDSDWGGNVVFTGHNMLTSGTTYTGTAYLEKYGAGNDGSIGDNSFAGNTELKNIGSGYFLMGNGSPDIFDNDLIMNNEGTSSMYLAHNSPGNSVDGDFTINNIGSGANNTIYISSVAASTIDITGNVTINNTSTADIANMYFANAGTTTILGDLSATNNSSGLNSQVILSNGNNTLLTVGGESTLINSGGAGTTKRFYIGNSGSVIFNDDISITNSSTAVNSEVFANYTATSNNVYNGNITLEGLNIATDGIYFGSNNGTGTISNGFSVSIGSGGFVASNLLFRNFTQLGTAVQNITITGPGSILENINSTWNGILDFKGPRHYTRGTTYNNTTILEKTSVSNDASAGGNIYNGNTQIINSGTGYFMPANGITDDFNADVSFIQTNTGIIYPNYNCVSTYAGNINIDYQNGQIYFGAAGNGRAILDGNTNQSINDLGSSTLPLFRDFQVDKTGGAVTLNMPIEIVTELDLDNGIVNTTAASLLTMRDNANVSSVSDASYIAGPIEKIGNDTFEFPVGDNGFHMPIAMSNPSSTIARFRAQYFDNDPHNSGYLGHIKDPSLGYVSDCEYWTLDRVATSNNVSVTLSFKPHGLNGCSGVTNPASLQVARWDGSMWKNHGNGGFTGTTVGTVTSTGTVNSFSPFALASLDIVANPLPIELINFDAKLSDKNEVLLTWQTASEINNDYFTVERSSNGVDFEFVGEIKGAGNSTTVLDYNDIDYNPINGQSFYRLKQTDFDGTYSYSHVKAINIDDNENVSIYPNPIVDGNSSLIISVAGFTMSEIIIIDNLGRVVYRNNTADNMQTIDLSTYEAGTYFVQIPNGANIITKRIVIQ